MSGLRESDRWHVLTGDAIAEREVRAATGVTPLAARVMVARGIRTAADAHDFLTPSLERRTAWSAPCATTRSSPCSVTSTWTA